MKPEKAALQKSVFYRNPCNVKPCAAFSPGVCIKCDTGCLFCSYVLVLGAYFKLQTFLYLTGNGVVQGMRPLIGYNYGAGESKRVKEIFRSALFLIVIVMVIGTILCMAVPQALIGLFTGNPETIRLGREHSGSSV